MSEAIFRRKALGRLASPEQLDELMKVTTPRGWLALVALSAIVLTAVAWGIFGQVPTRVSGQGIFIRPAGVFSIPSNGQGLVARVLVAEGDMIKAGDVVAEIMQVDLLAQIAQAKSELESEVAENEKVLAYCEKQRKLKMDYYTSQRANLESDIKEQRALVSDLKKLVAGLESLLKQELATVNDTMQGQQNLVHAEAQVRTLDDQLNDIPGEESDLLYNLEQKRFESQKSVDDVNRKIRLLQTQLDNAAKVVSAYSGRVLELMVDEGDAVNIGTAILSVEMLDQTMEAAIFISDTEGKRVQKGMVVEITPATVKREEYGYIIGQVDGVSEFPATEEGMMRLLHNESLVKQLSQNTVPLQVNVVLKLDPSTVSGYKWSSRKGPPLKISSGTYCSGSVVVREQPPVTLVIPILKKFFGLT